MTYDETISTYQRHFEDLLTRYIADYDCPIDGIKRAVAYSVLDGGKRIRPLLVYLGAEFCGREAKDVDYLALGLEMIHSYSLVHDDLPCMDNDVLRRGKPTTHVRFGEDMAVLAGDGLLNLAFETMLADCNTPYDVKAIKYVADCAGIRGMIGGQALDVANTSDDVQLSQIEYLNSLKTGRLIKAALVGSCIKCGGDARVIEAVEQYAECIGIIFQLVDDLLDLHSTADQLGKSVGKDAIQDKKTYVAVAGEERCRRTISSMLDKAIEAVEPYGRRADNLILFAKYLTQRLY
ncbi:MAG: polyprenyl synthetase family protein [Christensenellales bacterium]